MQSFVDSSYRLLLLLYYIDTLLFVEILARKIFALNFFTFEHKKSEINFRKTLHSFSFSDFPRFHPVKKLLIGILFAQ